MHEGEVSARLGMTGWPAVAEEAIIARDCLLAEHVGSRLHVCHLSTAGSVEIVAAAKGRGIAVTAEVTPHHLLLTDETARSATTRCSRSTRRCAPPPTSTRCGTALADGTIDIVATDHAPHASQDKECEWDNGQSRHARPADRAVGRHRDDGRTPDCSTGAGVAARDERDSRPDRRSRRPRPADRGR